MKKLLTKFNEWKKSKSKGFTILETLVAIFILVLSITGPLVFAQTGLRTAFVARDQMTAFFLAQDAIETIKNKRDQNLISSPQKSWLFGMDNCTSGGNACNIDTTQPAFTATNCGQSDCPFLKYVINDGQFVPGIANGSTEETSIFSRTVYVIPLGSVPYHEAEIIVKMKWRTNAAASGFRTIVIQENIFDWIP